MRIENGQSFTGLSTSELNQKPLRRTAPLAARALAATVLPLSGMLPFDTPPNTPDQDFGIPGSSAMEPYTTPQPQLAPQKDEDEQFADVLADNKMRALIASALAFSLVYGWDAYEEAKRTSSGGMRVLRTAGPALMALSVATYGVDSVTTIEREIPDAMLLGSLLLQSAATIATRFESRRDIGPRVRAMGLSTALTAMGVVFLVASR